MSKKLILNESITRRFMRLAEIENNLADQFLTELGEEEQEMELGGPPMGGEEEELPGDEGPEEEMPEEGADTVEVDAQELVGDIVAALQKQGADVSMEGGEEEAPEDGEEMEPAMGDEELPPEGGEEEPLMQELEDAGIKLADDEATINEVARRVAARLIKASKNTKR
jgi:hypothetical protein|tara:strand:- start:4215 stop:4718 length:504 start_codon:yes stop_codon:yes gene_type:complete